MNREQLRDLQAPLKERYLKAPEAALVTLRVSGRIGEGITCAVAGRGAAAGLHPAAGGDGLSLCSGDMLLEALVGCAGVTLAAVATSIGVELRAARLSAEGDLDFRGALGIAKDVPVGFREIRMRIECDSDASDEQLATLVRLTERYCVVYQTLQKGTSVSTTCERRPAES